MAHTSSYLVGSKTQMERNDQGGDGVIDRSFVDEGYLIAMLLALIYISNVAAGPRHLALRHEDRRFLVIARPVETASLVLRATDATAHDIVVGAIDNSLGVVEEL